MALIRKANEKKSRLMSIDPSINNLGVAIWDIGSKALLLRMLMHPGVKFRMNEYSKSSSMLDQLRELVTMYEVDVVVLEVPEHWAVG